MSSPPIAQPPRPDAGGRALIGEFRPGELLKTSQAAEFLGTHPHTVRGYMKSGLLAFRRLPGGHYRIPVEALEEFLRASEPPLRPRPAEVVAHAEPKPGYLEPEPRASSARSSRRPQLGHEPPRHYDVSIEALRAIRARLAS